mgnify:CR=1 FL=1
MVVVYNLMVILWGAWVRITGSGAGCGEHWPSCGGEIIPRDPQIETIIEFTHRLTSGFTLIFTLLITIYAFRLFSKGNPVRKMAVLTLIFVLSEAALGAILVLNGWVAKDTSIARAAVVALHLANTNGLIAFGALTAWWSHPRGALLQHLKRERWLFGSALLGLLIVGMTGAITALGDTLFPISPQEAENIITQIRENFSPTEHFLVRLRAIHPLLAVGVSLFLVGIATHVQKGTEKGADNPLTLKLAQWVVFLTLTQVGLGIINISLAAPGWMQLIHLFVADILWIALVLLWAQLAHPIENFQMKLVNPKYIEDSP